MRQFVYQLIDKFYRYRFFLKTLHISFSMLMLVIGMTVFVGFMVIQGQNLSFAFNRLTIRALAGKELAEIGQIIDGDTIRLVDGRVVRYIGIDAPELDKDGKVACFAFAAATANRRLVEGKRVQLEQDISNKDKYGRFLRYVWLDNILINERLVAEGFARSMPIAPNLKYSARLFKAHLTAKKGQLGLWGACE